VYGALNTELRQLVIEAELRFAPDAQVRIPDGRQQVVDVFIAPSGPGESYLWLGALDLDRRELMGEPR
jgi:hypothetical protein